MAVSRSRDDGFDLVQERCHRSRRRFDDGVDEGEGSDGVLLRRLEDIGVVDSRLHYGLVG